MQTEGEPSDLLAETELHFEDVDQDIDDSFEAPLPDPLPDELEAYSQEDTFLFRIPGFGDRKRAYIRAFRNSTRTLLEAFDSFEAISAEDRERIGPRVSGAIALIQGYQAWRQVVEDLPGIGYWLVIILSLVIPYLGLDYWYVADTGFWNVAGVVGVGIVTIIVYFALVFQTPDTRIGDLMVVLILLASGLAIGGLIQWESSWLSPVVRAGITGGLVASVIFFVAYFVLLYLFAIPRVNRDRAKVRRHPKEEIIETLCDVLTEIESYPDDWQEIWLQQYIVQDLEWISKRIEGELFASMYSDDANTTAWLRKSTAQMAANMRDLKKRVLLPEYNGREELIEELSRRLVMAADDNWGLFPRTEVPRSSGWHERARRYLRKGLVLAIPLLAVLAALKVESEFLNDTTRNYLVTVAIGWVLMNVLTWLDPKAEDKVSGLNTLSSMLPTGKKKAPPS